jgi:hypothetical protein
MQVRKHPLSEKWIVRYFVIVFVTLSAAIVLPPVLADHGFGAVLDRIGIYYVFGLFALFIGCFIRLISCNRATLLRRLRKSTRKA